MGSAAIAQILVAILPFLTAGVQDLIKVIESHRSNAIALNEWTPDQDAAFRAAVIAKTGDPAYQPDARTAERSPTTSPTTS